MIRHHFETQLTALRSSLFLMSGRVRDEFALAYNALVNRDRDTVEAVYTLDREVDQLRSQIEQKCFLLISRQQPVATDLHLIITIYNINVDLDRMGDQARGIARCTDRMLVQPPVSLPHDLDAMQQWAQSMHDQAFDAWARHDVPQAEQILAQDEEVDALYARVQAMLFAAMAETSDPNAIQTFYELIRVAREVERFADLACNIARDVIRYMHAIELGPSAQP